MLTEIISSKKHLKSLVPIAVAISLAACGGSSNDEPDVLADVPMDGDPTPTTDPVPGIDPTPTTDPAPGTDVPSTETALETASRVDIPRYDLLIENVRAVVNVDEFTGENYVSAIAAIAESSEAQVVYGHIDFLSLLESQIITDESLLTPLDISEAGLNENQSDINRAHTCPDGGRLLATKTDLSNQTDLSGNFSFDECQIGGVLIDGGYEIRTNPRDNGALADVTMGVRINGVDGVSTSLSGAILNEVTTTDGTLTNETRLNTTTTVTVPAGVVLSMEVAVLSTQTAGEDNASLGDIPPEETYTVSLGNVRAWVDDDNNARLTGNTANETDLTKAPNTSTFEQGEIEFYLLPNTNVMNVNADNGDPASFDAFVTLTDDSVVSFIFPWDSGDYTFGPQGKRIPLSLPPAAE